MKHILAIFATFGLTSLFAQSTFTLTGFSDLYEGRFIVEKGFEKKNYKKGTLYLLDKSTQSEILKIESHEFVLDVEKLGMEPASKKEILYQNQQLIINSDFDFDGIKDFALMDGQNSCYHNSSYRIYLTKGDQLTFSPEFTRLAQEYCGLFKVDLPSKTIHTVTKSGCCWHERSEFKVIEGIPKPVLLIVESSDGPFFTTQTQTWKAGIKSETQTKRIDLKHEEVIELLSFNLEKSGKKVILYHTPYKALNYVLIQKDDGVEFNFPPEYIFENPDFILSQSQDRLSFSNGTTIYQIYENRGPASKTDIGIKVKTNGKSYDLKGDPKTLRGSLKNIRSLGLNNVVDED